MNYYYSIVEFVNVSSKCDIMPYVYVIHGMLDGYRMKDALWDIFLKLLKLNKDSSLSLN